VAKNKKQKLGNNNENAFQEEFASESNFSGGAAKKAGKNSNPSKN